MASSRLRLAAVIAVALAVGFLIGTWRSGVHIETGEAHSTGNGGGSIITDGWTYGFPADIAWVDTNNSWHEGGLPNCLPPLSIVDGVRFAWVEANAEGTGWRPVVWIDCRGVPLPSAAASNLPSAAVSAPLATASPVSGLPAATLVFRTAAPPPEPTPGPSVDVGCAGAGIGPFTLHGKVTGSEVLVWLEQEDHRQFAAVWPQDFAAAFNPELQLFDADGTLVAREGDTIEGGGLMNEGYSNLFYVWSFSSFTYPCLADGWVEP